MGVSAALYIAGASAETYAVAATLTAAAAYKATTTGVDMAKTALTPKMPGMPGIPGMQAAPKMPDSQASQANSSAANTQRLQAQGAYGGGNTILTGPLGMIGGAAGSRKTLLGA